MPEAMQYYKPPLKPTPLPDAVASPGRGPTGGTDKCSGYSKEIGVFS